MDSFFELGFRDLQIGGSFFFYYFFKLISFAPVMEEKRVIAQVFAVVELSRTMDNLISRFLRVELRNENDQILSRAIRLTARLDSMKTSEASMR